jgi:beta-glucosidase
MGLNPSMEGEEGDAYNGCNSGDKTDIELPPSQAKLLKEIAAIGKPIIFINISGSCVNLSLPNECCDAVLQVFYPGAEGGQAVADILYGKTSPSGRLPVTFYKGTEQLPDFREYSMENRTYRYMKEEPLFPFGFGLSYTEFEVGEVEYEPDTVTCTVKNLGNYDGAEVVKVYIKSPGYEQLNKQLAGYGKVFLKQGEQKRLHISLCKEIMEQMKQYGEVQFELEK